jgi:GNAT superfamily N-acetyltransferase
MNISIQKLNLSYLEPLTDILSRVVQHLISNGIDQWDDKYPNAEILIRDLESQWAYGLFCDSQLAGYIVLNEFQDKEYAEIPWKYTSGSQLTIHRLFIDPQYQGKGLAQKNARLC